MTKWKKIRKDAGDISIADLMEYSSWEYCLDEEMIEEQSECTMRPCNRNKILRLADYCCVACNFVLPSGVKFLGWIELNGETKFNAWSLSPEIFLTPEAEVPKRGIEEFSLITNWQFVGACTRIRFSLPSQRIVDDQSLQPRKLEVARALGVSLSELFPISLEPLQRIKGWPSGFQLTSFSRPPDDVPYRRFGELDAPDCPYCGKQLRTKRAKQCFECGEKWQV